jgi:hypothetical protein
MAVSFATLAAVTVTVVLLSTAITYVTVLYLHLPFAAVLAAMIVVGLLNAVLRTAIVSNVQEVRSAYVKRPAFEIAGVTPEETASLFVAYLAIALIQLYILQSRFTLRERAIIVMVTGASNALFRNLL